MERKRIEKIVALLLVGILIPVSLFPFRINADTIDSHIIGRNISYEFIQGDQYNGYAVNQSVFHVEIVLDGDYLGYMQPNFTLQYYNYFYGANPPAWNTMSISFTNRVFVNGNTVNFDIPLKWNSLAIGQSSNGTSPYFYDSYTITSSDVTSYGELTTLEDIVNILTDINNNIEIDILDELQTICDKLDLSNDYLKKLSDIRYTYFPYESWPFISRFIQDDYYTLIDYKFIDRWTYPIFRADNPNNRLDLGSQALYPDATDYRDDSVYYIFATNVTPSNFNNYFEIYGANVYMESLERLASFSLANPDTNVLENWSVFRCEFKTSGSAVSMRLYAKKNPVFIIPFYKGWGKNISTEFALEFGLSNQLLDNIQIIANGTQQSQSSSGSLDQTTSQFSDDANDLVTIEESFNNSMNQSLQNVNPTFNMGSSFLTSANWVSQQFNRIVNNTPFASLITFGLTLGLGLLIIGKVRK